MGISDMFDAAEKKIESAIAHEKEVITNYLSPAQKATAPEVVAPEVVEPVKVSDIPVLTELVDLVEVGGLVVVLLIKDHTHEGMKLLSGAELKVSAEIARWLVLMRVAVLKQ